MSFSSYFLKTYFKSSIKAKVNTSLYNLSHIFLLLKIAEVQPYTNIWKASLIFAKNNFTKPKISNIDVIQFFYQILCAAKNRLYQLLYQSHWQLINTICRNISLVRKHLKFKNQRNWKGTQTNHSTAVYLFRSSKIFLPTYYQNHLLVQLTSLHLFSSFQFIKYLMVSSLRLCNPNTQRVTEKVCLLCAHTSRCL